MIAFLIIAAYLAIWAIATRRFALGLHAHSVREWPEITDPDRVDSDDIIIGAIIGLWWPVTIPGALAYGAMKRTDWFSTDEMRARREAKRASND